MICVMGAAGRLGRILNAVWRGRDAPGPVLWQGRGPGLPPGWLGWDVLREDWPAGHPAAAALRGGIFLCLSGVTRGDAAAMAQNVTLALAACDAARRCGARHVFLCSSAAVYGAGTPAGGAFSETDALAPTSDYGRAKVEMERLAFSLPAGAGAGLPGITALRIGNVLGADSLIGGMVPNRPVILDPVAGQAGGPVRSYIGPATLAHVLRALCDRVQAGAEMPKLLNIAAPGGVAMGDLLDAAGQDWRFGPENPQVLPRVVLQTTALQACVPLPATAASPAAMVAEWRGLGMDQTGARGA